jgi:hypothetical protein
VVELAVDVCLFSGSCEADVAAVLGGVFADDQVAGVCRESLRRKWVLDIGESYICGGEILGVERDLIPLE